MKNMSKASCLVVVASLVTACGGGSSKSGGSSNIFVGKQEVRITQSRTTSPTRSTDFRLTLNGNQITIFDTQFTISAVLAGQSFTATSPSISISAQNSSCTSFTITYTGTVTESMVTGQITGALDCVVPATIEGSFSASNGGGSGGADLPSVAVVVVGGG